MTIIVKQIGTEVFEYNNYRRRKRNGGFRVITAPDERLKSYQKEFADFFYLRVRNEFTPEITGFMPGMSIKDNARVHTNKEWVINIDIKSFFPSTTAALVKTALVANGIEEFKHFDLDQIVDVLTLDGALPQGSPASPVIANYIALHLVDPIIKEKIVTNLGQIDYDYTRYADDITFSFNDQVSRTALRALVDDIVNYLGTRTPFKVARDKIHVRSRSQRQSVTGIIVNQGFSINKKERLRLRAVMHKVRLGELEMDSKLKGKLNYVREINPALYRKLLQGVDL